MCWSSGGAGGKIDFPTYLKNIHKEWLKEGTRMTTTIEDLLITSQGAGGNPYDGETPFNPGVTLNANNEISSLTTDSPLDRMRATVLTSKNLVSAIDPTSDYSSYMTQANSELTKFADIDFLDNLSSALTGLMTAIDTALSDTYITDLVTAYQSNKETRFLRDVSLWSAGMADINAVNTSSFVMGLALMQNEFSASVDTYERELKFNVYSKFVDNAIRGYIQARVGRTYSQDQVMLLAPNIMDHLQTLKAQLTQQQASLTITAENIIAETTRVKVEKQLALDVDDATWEMAMYQRGANVLSSISGSSGYVPDKVSAGTAALKGAFEGASIGAAIPIPGGAAIGAAAGGLLGWAFN